MKCAAFKIGTKTFVCNKLQKVLIILFLQT